MKNLLRRFSLWFTVPGTHRYWERRYLRGRDSGIGSYGRLAEFKAEVLNDLIRRHDVATVTEWGCGDGNQLELAEYPRYVGLEVSEAALWMCRERFGGDETKAFAHIDEYDGWVTDASLSLDVIYHLVEDDVYERYMRDLFRSAERLVVIYSSNTDENPVSGHDHVRHRRFTSWIEMHEPDWALIGQIPNRYPVGFDDGDVSFADFYVYGRREESSPTPAADSAPGVD